MCKFGLVGSNCPFSHPRQCENFLWDGHGEQGCRRENCKYLHPSICGGSWRNRECFKTNCNLPHLKGTKRGKKLPQNQTAPSPTGTSPAPNQQTKTLYSTAVNGNQIPQETQPNPPQENLLGFQEMKVQMRDLQNSIMFLMGIVRLQLEAQKPGNLWGRPTTPYPTFQ